MGLFSKERHGELKVVAPGRQYVWVIQNVLSYSNTTLDSPKSKSFAGASFHFHMVVGVRGDIGFYIHYKTPDIPKYSYFFTGGQGMLRQHTAHNIPPKIERCGHWNVCTIADIRTIVSPTDGVLRVVFQFDDDVLRNKGGDGRTFEWIIPRAPSQKFSPFASNTFNLQNVKLVMRIETKGDTITSYVYARKGVVPAHTLSVCGSNGTTLFSGKPVTPDTALEQCVATFDLEAFKKSCQPNGALTIMVMFEATNNPFDQLNSFRQSPSGKGKPEDTPLRTVAVASGDKGGAASYVAFDAD